MQTLEEIAGLTIHPAASIFPLMSQPELEELAEDIRQNGLRRPITVLNGQVVDGRNRLTACQLAGVEPRAQEWDGEGSLIAYIVSENISRRHLSPSQKAMLAVELLPHLQEEASARQKASLKKGAAAPVTAPGRERGTAPGRERGTAAAAAAKSLGAAERTVERAKRVAEAAPELAAKVKAGEVSLKDAERTIANPRHKARNVEEAWKGDDKNVRFTPRALIEERHYTHRFTVDVASDPTSPAAQVIGRFWTIQDDGLEQSWKDERVWCNHPWEFTPDWVAKADREMRQNGCLLVDMLLPANRTEQPWWQEFIEPFRDRPAKDGVDLRTEFIGGRVSYGNPRDPEGEHAGSPEFGSVLVTWRRVGEGGQGESGTCKSCGCTEERACEGGCAWINDEETLCTACVELEPEDKPVEKKGSASPQAGVCKHCECSGDCAGGCTWINKKGEPPLCNLCSEIEKHEQKQERPSRYVPTAEEELLAERNPTGQQVIVDGLQLDDGRRCGLVDGKRGKACILEQGHDGVHSTGTRTWSVRKAFVPPPGHEGKTWRWNNTPSWPAAHALVDPKKRGAWCGAELSGAKPARAKDKPCKYCMKALAEGRPEMTVRESQAAAAKEKKALAEGTSPEAYEQVARDAGFSVRRGSRGLLTASCGSCPAKLRTQEAGIIEIDLQLLREHQRLHAPKAKPLPTEGAHLRESIEAYRNGKDVCPHCGIDHKRWDPMKHKGAGWLLAGMKGGKYALPLCSKCSGAGLAPVFVAAEHRKAWEAAGMGAPAPKPTTKKKAVKR